MKMMTAVNAVDSIAQVRTYHTIAECMAQELLSRLEFASTDILSTMSCCSDAVNLRYKNSRLNAAAKGQKII